MFLELGTPGMGINFRKIYYVLFSIHETLPLTAVPGTTDASA